MTHRKEDNGASQKSGLNHFVAHLLHRAGQFATDFFQLESDGFNLTARQFAVLVTVAEEGGLTQSELVERTGIDRSTLADIVARLLGRGLIGRHRAKHDGRAYQIDLTKAGEEILEIATPCAEAADAKLLSRLPPGRRQDFVDSLKMIVSSGDDQG